MTTSILQFNNEAEIAQAVETSRQTFKAGYTKPIKFRRHQLEQLWLLLDENQDAICDAVFKDLHKHRNETQLGEIAPSKEEIRDALEHVDEWARDEKVAPFSLVNKFGVTCYMRKEPKGSTLIISPWNYPIYLTMGPLVGALVAGCTAIVKPSEVAPHSAKLLTDLLPRYLDSRAYIIINGGAHETTKLLEYKWDHIFYTGNGTVAKIIMKAAAEHLTPVTLELGGKSPVFVDEDTNMAIAAKRIAFGKTFNAGQTCVAPDYLLLTAKAEERLVPELKKTLKEMYGENPQASDFARIINNRHFHRLTNVLKGNKSGKIVVGGQTDEKDLYIAPTVITGVDREDKLMEDELFGPFLPIIRVADVDDAIEFINSKDDPLALYIFSTNKKLTKKILDSTRSGGVVINDTLMHVTEGALPFGGIGPSGLGSYHGKKSFDAFTHERSILVKQLNIVSEAVLKARYPPYTSINLKLGRFALEGVPHFRKNFIMKYFKWIVIALIFGIGYKRIA
ncbi:Aldehyde dehydrogenase [Lobosporangium transversale]|uniref:Aldehyde dehydrogenase n=1 Tax=Lobosporangium transversale TaxID=64571 RepID=A0A1Y2GUY3_9FUNG|nr:aldehyde dehydrogenase 3 family, member B1 [Lobosporangium transversale]KAF9917892.1 Aldehyde dehydrogenase [Lobosporangium transversale]ORZ24900.1 aldehyde dehydrogenase 3 family, member B1 [Lobosporangium transversale]|eukprot:XP_021883881.1 aldehyde dehydrogenase 3 family, member B1 [Lobosporangium transversale]